MVQEESEVKAEEVDQAAEEERIAAQKKAKSKKKQVPIKLYECMIQNSHFVI